MRGVLRDLEGSALPDKEKALLRFVAKVNAHSPEISADEVAPLRAQGWTDEALYYAITVCALFNFYNRWIDACGVHEMTDDACLQFAARTAQSGYVRK